MGHFLPQKQLVGLKLGDAPLVSCDHRRAVSIDDPVEKLFDFPVNFTQLFFDHLARLFGVQGLAVPRIAERSRRKINELFGGCDRFQHFLERTFDLGARIGFAAHVTRPLSAKIVRIGRAHAPLTPIRGQCMTTGRAADMTTQGEIVADIGAGCATRLALQSFLNLIEGFDADKRLMLADPKREIPRRHEDDTRIERVRQNLFHTLVRHFAIAHLWHCRLRFEKAHHFGLAGKTPARVAFECVLNNGCQRFMTREDFPAARPAGIFITPRCLKRPKPLLHSGSHAVERLLRILLPCVLAYTGEEVFDQFAVGIFAELDGRRFQRRAGCANFCTKLQMRIDPAREARDVINHNDMGMFARGAQKFDHRIHAGASGDATRHIVLEYVDDLIALMLAKQAASLLL